jgi:hypothetical protein
MNNIDIITDTISIVEQSINLIDSLGSYEEILSDGVLKYSASDSRVTHFLVFKDEQIVKEISFYCENENFSLSNIKKLFGPGRSGYNFRENYTQFTFDLDAKKIDQLFFIKDNKFEFVSENKVIEKDPRGKSKEHKEILFSGFCLKLSDKKLLF